MLSHIANLQSAGRLDVKTRAFAFATTLTSNEMRLQRIFTPNT